MTQVVDVAAGVLEEFDAMLRLVREAPEERGAIHDAVRRVCEIFSRTCGVDAFDFNGTPDILLPTGKALGMAGAAFCLLEAQRTAVFLRGIEDAVRELQRRFPGERIRILYAGSGPFASLVTPLTARFRSEEVGWHLLEINPASLAAVERLYSALELEEYLLGAELADASRFVFPKGERFHLVLSETMQRALRNETQLAIALNLLPQMEDGALFLPEKISVIAAAFRPSWPHGQVGQPRFEELGTIYELGQEHRAAPETCHVRVPALATPGGLNLLTRVQVYGREVLAGNDSSITLPQNMHRELQGGEDLVFDFRWTPRPGFACEVAAG